MATSTPDILVIRITSGSFCFPNTRWELDPVVASFMDNCSSFLMPKEDSGFGMVPYRGNRSNSTRQIIGRMIKASSTCLSMLLRFLSMNLLAEEDIK